MDVGHWNDTMLRISNDHNDDDGAVFVMYVHVYMDALGYNAIYLSLDIELHAIRLQLLSILFSVSLLFSIAE